MKINEFLINPVRSAIIARRSLIRQFVLYASVGGIQLLADWTCFVLLTSLGMDVIPANLLSRIFGAILGFFLNRQYTFSQQSTGPLHGRKQIARFSAGWIFTAILSTTCVWLLDNLAGIGAARFGKLFVDATLALFGFALSKYWIFR